MLSERKFSLFAENVTVSHIGKSIAWHVPESKISIFQNSHGNHHSLVKNTNLEFRNEILCIPPNFIRQVYQYQ